jgi:hypothetical protein
MSTWSPVVTVTIAGTDFTGDTVDTLQLRRGRNNVYASIQAAVASITLLDKTGTGIVPSVADSVVVTLEDSAATPVTLFVGEVSDFSTSIYDAGIRNTPAAQIRITAVSGLAKLQRRQVFATGRGVEKDGDRVLAVLLDGLAVPWEEAAGVWDDYTTETWLTFEPSIDFTIVDTPGLFDISALAALDGGYSAGQTAGEAGLSANGLLYETADGRIGYADGLRRFNNVALGYLPIPSAVLTASQLSTSSQLADLANAVVVSYAGGEVTDTDPDSIEQFGRFTQQLSTSLQNLGDAETRAETFLETHSQPTVQFESASIRLEQDMNDTLRNNLLRLEVNDAVEIDTLPATLGLTTFTGFLEGVIFTVDPFRTNIDLLLSAANLSLGPVFWAAVANTIAWEDVDAALQWTNAGSL